jgi:hypothetical protein
MVNETGEELVLAENLEDILKQMPLPKPELDHTSTDDFNDELTSILANENSRSAPTIDNLQDAVIFDTDGTVVFIPEVGQRVIIERWFKSDGEHYWLDTETYKIIDIDYDTGDLKLHNESLRQAAKSNYINGVKHGYRFKMPEGMINVGKKQRGRPKRRRNEYSEPPSKPMGEQKKRGRPAGAKNRPKEVVAAEKIERAEQRKQKRAKREARKGRRVMMG